MSRYVKKEIQKPHFQGYQVTPKTIGEHFKKRRIDLEMYQKEITWQLKISEDCVCYWENRRSRLNIKYYPAIIAFLGYYPFDHEIATFGGKITRYKYEQGMSNEKQAKAFGVDN